MVKVQSQRSKNELDSYGTTFDGQTDSVKKYRIRLSVINGREIGDRQKNACELTEFVCPSHSIESTLYLSVDRRIRQRVNISTRNFLPQTFYGALANNNNIARIDQRSLDPT
jgi:hypothetical protein